MPEIASRVLQRRKADWRTIAPLSPDGSLRQMNSQGLEMVSVSRCARRQKGGSPDCPGRPPEIERFQWKDLARRKGIFAIRRRVTCGHSTEAVVEYLLTLYRESHGRKQIRRSTRNPGPDGAYDLGTDGASARVWYRTAYRTSEQKYLEPESGDDLPGLAALAAPGLDQVGMGHFGEQSPRQILFVEPLGKEANRERD